MNTLLTACAGIFANFAIHLLGWDSHIVRWIHRKLRYSRKDSKGLLRHFVRQHIWLALSYTVLPWLVLIAGLFFMAALDSACTNTPIDWGAWIDTLPQEIKYLVAILFFWIPPVVLGTVVYRRQRRKMRNIIEQSLTTPLCIHCGFDLSDQAQPDSDSVFCTDCGNSTPFYPKR